MEPVLALLQTVLWVGLVGGIVWRFNRPIHSLLTALADRIQTGSDVKAGPFEITKYLQPLPPEAQAKKVEAEIREEARLTLVGPQTEESTQPPSVKTMTSLRARYYEVEDLALRAVQNEFDEPISRQVTGGRDEGFDGVFFKDKILRIVEVKISSGRYPRPIVAKAVKQLSTTLESYGWRHVRLVIVVVVVEEDRLAEAKSQLHGFVPNSSYPVDVRCYSFNELRSMFNLTGEKD